MPDNHNASLTFDLLIDPHEAGYRARVINGPAGEEQHDFVLPFHRTSLREWLALPDLLYDQLRLSASATNRETLDPMRFGAALFKAVFAEGIYTSLLRSLDEAQRQQTHLQLRLRLSATPALAFLPWEYLFLPARDQFLALGGAVTLQRYLDLPAAKPALAVTGPLRLLVMLAAPDDAPRLDGEREWTQLQQALQDGVAAGQLVVERVPATAANLQRRLRKGEYHLFHFIGHGWIDEQTGTSGLHLEDENGHGAPLEAQQLALLLTGQRSLRLAFLNACIGARPLTGAAFSGTAQQLVRQNLPAVIAMQFPITDQSATHLAAAFYQALAAGYPVDLALNEARKALYVTGETRAWATPVLFLRAEEARLFAFAHSPTAAADASTTAAAATPPPNSFTIGNIKANIVNQAGTLNFNAPLTFTNPGGRDEA